MLPPYQELVLLSIIYNNYEFVNIIMARCMKMERREDMWSLKNIRTKDLATLEKLGFVPQRTVKIS